MPLDPTIALQVRPPADPLEGYGRALTLKGLLGQQQMQDAQIAAAQRQRDEETTLADLYRQSLGSDGQVNRSAVLRGAADRGLGARIPGLQKQWLDADKAGADLAHTQAQTGKLGAETAGLQIKAEADRAGYVVDLVSRLAGRPNVTHDDIIAELAQVPPQYRENAARMARSLPGDPGQLRNYLLTIGLQAQDRLKALTPALQQVNDGKTTRFVDTNALTNPGGPAPIAMQTTPGEDLTAKTSRENNAATVGATIRGQNLTDQRQRDLNAITREGQQTQVVNDAERGVLLVNKGTGLVRPGVGLDGKPVPSESAAKRQSGAQRVLPLLDEAEKLIKQSTGSYVGAAVDEAGRAVGASTGGARAAAQLKAIEGQLMMAQPRMEGPQSNLDVQLYRQMAGSIGDPTVPNETKAAALKTIRSLQQKYAAGNDAASQLPAPQPAAPLSPPKPGTVQQGFIFMGGDPALESSWMRAGGAR